MRLYSIGPKKGCAQMLTGVNRISDLPASQKLNVRQKRQIRAMKEQRIIVEPGLGKALGAVDGKLSFLDFETNSRAVPVWPGQPPDVLDDILTIGPYRDHCTVRGGRSPCSKKRRRFLFRWLVKAEQLSHGIRRPPQCEADTCPLS